MEPLKKCDYMIRCSLLALKKYCKDEMLFSIPGIRDTYTVLSKYDDIVTDEVQKKIILSDTKYKCKIIANPERTKLSTRIPPMVLMKVEL
jgi:hypothetical protein